MQLETGDSAGLVCLVWVALARHSEGTHTSRRVERRGNDAVFPSRTQGFECVYQHVLCSLQPVLQTYVLGGLGVIVCVRRVRSNCIDTNIT